MFLFSFFNSVHNSQKRDRCSSFQCVSNFFSGEVFTVSVVYELYSMVYYEKPLQTAKFYKAFKLFTQWDVKYIEADVFRV